MPDVMGVLAVSRLSQPLLPAAMWPCPLFPTCPVPTRSASSLSFTCQATWPLRAAWCVLVTLLSARCLALRPPSRLAPVSLSAHLHTLKPDPPLCSAWSPHSTAIIFMNMNLGPRCTHPPWNTLSTTVIRILHTIVHVSVQYRRPLSILAL
ncbi:hypothetical protein C8R44DRAFT_880508 [Mycena epipterygia]|nr:hypothetical protein C8R44DRAFT_880500 [Mycena epipterygia]KAJ7115186.1 hypothetical protein C8R44DRAFT_880508 [Mycena epipterygia]